MCSDTHACTDIQKQVSMIRNCHNYRPQTNLSHGKDEIYNTNNHMTASSPSNNYLWYPDVHDVVRNVQVLTLVHFL